MVAAMEVMEARVMEVLTKLAGKVEGMDVITNHLGEIDAKLVTQGERLDRVQAKMDLSITLLGQVQQEQSRPEGGSGCSRAGGAINSIASPAAVAGDSARGICGVYFDGTTSATAAASSAVSASVAQATTPCPKFAYYISVRKGPICCQIICQHNFSRQIGSVRPSAAGKGLFR